MSSEMLPHSGKRSTSVGSVVFYYDDLPDELARLIERIQQFFQRSVKERFLAKDRREIHATLIGLQLAPEASTIDYEGLLKYLCSKLKRHPLKIQFGGFDNEHSLLLSRGRPLRERTIWCENGLVTLIGWPVVPSPRGGTPYDELDKIRRNCQRYHVVHKYHNNPYEKDPDMYLVIGSYEESTSTLKGVYLAAKEAQSFLSNTHVLVDADASNLKVVVSDHVSLPYSTSISLPICEADTLSRLHRTLVPHQKRNKDR
jgi:hypothetical protein